MAISLSNFFDELFEYRVRRIVKRLYQPLYLSNVEKRLIFIIGCQRSGTTMLTQSFERDWRVRYYGEHGFSPPQVGYMLEPAQIEQIIGRYHAPINVIKPLVDSQNVARYLAYFPTSRAIWVYRHYQNVARSNLVRWGFENVKNHLRRLIDGNPNAHWASQYASAETAQVVRRFYDEQMSPNDASVLFWYVRNKLYFDLGLDDHPQVTICRYKELVEQPSAMLRDLYAFANIRYPGDYLASHIHTNAAKVRRSFAVSGEVAEVCDALLARLDAAFEQRQFQPTLPAVELA